jgi:hypothetical protein
VKLSNLKFKDIINPVKWWHFIVGTLIRLLTGGSEYYEQVNHRMKTCSDCVENKSCFHCGCTMPDGMLVKGNKCSNGKWGPMLKKEQWKQYKKIYKL